MSEENDVISIEIAKEIPFFGEGDSLENRLRKVGLRGFPNIKIYEKAEFEVVHLTPDQIRTQLHTPQPNVYAPNLERVSKLAKLFKDKGIDISRLDKAYDFYAKSSTGEETQWTMLPAIVERWEIPKHNKGGLNYESLIGEELKAYLRANNLWINPEVESLEHSSPSGIFDIINDGAHRIHHGFMNGGATIIRVKGITPGFPYYAAPQPYISVKLVGPPTPETTAMKKHVVQDPAQKQLYRLFPSGGIMSGAVRVATAGEKFI